MLTLVLLTAVIASHGAQAWGTTGWGITASPSCRYNCGRYFGYCDCTSSCEYYGNCCWDYHTYCSGTSEPITMGQTTEGPGTTRSPSCGGNCGRDLGSCSCTFECQGLDNCCHDFYRECPHMYTPTAPEPTTAVTSPSCWGNCGRDLGRCSCSYSCHHRGDCCPDYSYYCAPETTTLPPTPTYEDTAFTHDLSCRWNCGLDLGICSCSFSCQYRGDCCLDFYRVCITTDGPTTFWPSTDGLTTDGPTEVSGPSCWGNCGRDLGRCSCSYSCHHRGDCCPDYSYYCAPWTTTLPTTTNPYEDTAPTHFTHDISCRWNCGRDFGICSCTDSCEYRGDCCFDFHLVCFTTYGPTTSWQTNDGLTTDGPTTAGPSCRNNCGLHLGSCSCIWHCQNRGNCCDDFDWYCHPYTSPDPNTPELISVPTGGSCGGSLSGSGSFSSPNYPGYYHDRANCNWQIQTSSDQTLYLRFTHVDLENCCNCDYILVYDGPSVNSRLLGKICRENNNIIGSSEFHSSSNYLTVVFRSDGSVVARGFNAEFTSSLSSNLGRVECSSDNMNIIVSKSYLNSVGIDPANLYLNDQYCRPSYTSYNVVFNFPINTCGTVRKFDEDRIVYTNALRSFASSYGEITRQALFRLNVSCQMEEDSVSQIMYEVKHSDRVSISGSGRYNTSMAFYTSSSFYTQVTQVPYLVTLNQYLYVKVSLRRGDSSLVLFLDTCVASPSPHDFQTRTYDLIRNGCRADSTFYTYSSGTAPYARFRFQAFQFLRATEHVYIQCKVLICPAAGYNRCHRGCVTRKARDLGAEHHVETVVLGPIQLQEEVKGGEEAEPETEPETMG